MFPVESVIVISMLSVPFQLPMNFSDTDFSFLPQATIVAAIAKIANNDLNFILLYFKICLISGC